MELNKLLKQGSVGLGVSLDDQAIDNLLAYKDFMMEYNQKVNLTAITVDEEFVVKHLLDCITIVPLISHVARVIDVGTGAGLPGIVLKIVRPDLNMTLLDARAKKLKFLDEAIDRLGLENARTIHGRAEDICKQKGFGASFDFVVSRAVASMDTLCGWCLPFVKRGGKFIAMKGPNYKDELDSAAPVVKKMNGKIENITELMLPNTDIARSIIIISKKSP